MCLAVNRIAVNNKCVCKEGFHEYNGICIECIYPTVWNGNFCQGNVDGCLTVPYSEVDPVNLRCRCITGYRAVHGSCVPIPGFIYQNGYTYDWASGYRWEGGNDQNNDGNGNWNDDQGHDQWGQGGNDQWQGGNDQWGGQGGNGQWQGGNGHWQGNNGWQGGNGGHNQWQGGHGGHGKDGKGGKGGKGGSYTPPQRWWEVNGVPFESW